MKQINLQESAYEIDWVTVVNAYIIEEMNISGLKLEDIQNEDTQND